MGTGIDIEAGSNGERHPRWERTQRAILFDQYRDLQAAGISPRQAAKKLQVPRSPLPAWRAWHATLATCPHVVAFLQSGPGLAYLHRLVRAFHVVVVEIGAWGMRLVCLFWEMTGLDRFGGASFGPQQRSNRGVEEAMVPCRRQETGRLAQAMAPKESTVAHDETFTGGPCLVAIEPVSHYILLEQTAVTRAQDTWSTLMTHALAPLKCNVIQSTSDEAPGL